MAKMILTVEKSNVDLIIDGTVFDMMIDKEDEKVHFYGRLENGATFIIDGIETSKMENTPKEKKEKPAVKTPVPVEEVKQPEPPKTPEPEQQQPFTNHAMSNISQKQRAKMIIKQCADSIAKDLASGMKQMDVAKKYGVSASTISKFSREHVRMISNRMNSKEEDAEETKTLATVTQIKPEANKEPITPPAITSLISNIAGQLNSTEEALCPAIEGEVVDDKPDVVNIPTFKTTVIIPTEEPKDVVLDADTEAEILNKLIDDIPIVKLAKEYEVSKETIHRVFKENIDFITRSRDARARIPKRAQTPDMVSNERLQKFAKAFGTR